MKLRKYRAALVAGATLVAMAVTTPADAHSSHGKPTEPQVVATGLDNPRLLAFQGSSLYVAEAGAGGDGPCLQGPEGDEVCFGLSGAVTRIDRSGQSRVIENLPSLASKGMSASGPSDVEPISRTRYKVTIGLGMPPEQRASLPPEAAIMGTQISGQFGGKPGTVVADLAAYEAANDPDGKGADSNPVGTTNWRGRTLIADAGGNSVISVQRGELSTVAVLPETEAEAPPFLGEPPGTMIPVQAVPTSVAVGPDGAIYVSQLTGFPFPPGGSAIYRIPKRGGTPEVWATGLTNVTDLAWYEGRLYAVQLTNAGLLNVPPGELPTGSLVRVPKGSTSPVVLNDSLTAPYGVAIRQGSAYVTTCAICAGDGQVVRIPLKRNH